MDIKTQIILSLTSYKIMSLVVGSLFAYMGYKLFLAGIWGHAGELETEFGDNKLILKKAAPGTFFALFGAVIIAITLYKGLEFKDYTSSIINNSGYIDIKDNADETLPDEPPF